MKGEAVQQIPPLATLGRDDGDGRSFGSGLRPTLRMTEATGRDDTVGMTETTAQKTKRCYRRSVTM